MKFAEKIIHKYGYEHPITICTIRILDFFKIL